MPTTRHGLSFKELPRGTSWDDYAIDRLHAELDSYSNADGTSLVSRLEVWGSDVLSKGVPIKVKGVVVGWKTALKKEDFKRISLDNLSFDQRDHIIEHSEINAIFDLQSRYNTLTDEEKHRLSNLKRRYAWQKFERQSRK